MKKQVRLKNATETLQIPYPKGFEGEKSGSEEDAEFHLSIEPRFLTVSEIEVAQEFIKRLPYPQSIVMTGCVLIEPDDPLLMKSHNEIDLIEKSNGMSNTRRVNNGERSVLERVLILRERGFLGSNSKVLSGK
jgi:hypothetical protein